MVTNPTYIEITAIIEPAFTPHELFSDGEPDVWSPEDVARLIREENLSFAEFIERWNLALGATLRIKDNLGRVATVSW